ncbi:dUTPase [Eptesipox virus]|uniref:Deoxyuridine 5'-triphosphate nucleotidohydrolase n=1 Tax=Eptesipox virus TaxID=1329402 RepID=A0A220T678_9POXV|nr:dUTPase [Eptesipox virus]ASK51218.1 dUTPase [Eptesipox virus]WAH70976.1 dUTPase [Eptesipox virus]
MVLKFVKLSEYAYAPTKESKHAAGFDLKSAYDYEVPANSRILIKTDIAIVLPSGCYGRIAPRSGLSFKHSIDIGAGVIDADYRGNVGIVFINNSNLLFTVKRGDRVAQLICEKIIYTDIVEESSLDNTDRGDNGFGSTGIN